MNNSSQSTLPLLTSLLIFHLFISLIIFIFDQRLPLLDSARGFQQFLWIQEHLKNLNFISFFKTITYEESFHLLFILPFSLLKGSFLNYRETLFLNHGIGLLLFLGTFTYFLRQEEQSWKQIFFPLTLILIHPHFFSLNKVLLPELFGFALLFLFLNFLLKSKKLTFFWALLVGLILSLTNFSMTLVWVPLFFTYFFFYKSSFDSLSKKSFFTALIIFFFITLHLSPYVPPLHQLPFNFYLQMKGFINRTLTLPWLFAFLLYQGLNLGFAPSLWFPQKKHRWYLWSFLISLILLAALRPSSGVDFFFTGFRYQLPLILLLLLALTPKVKTPQNCISYCWLFLWVLLHCFHMSQSIETSPQNTSFESMTQKGEYFRSHLEALHFTPTKEIPISGGGNKGILFHSPLQEHFLKPIKSLIKESPIKGGSLWISTLDPGEELVFQSNTFLLNHGILFESLGDRRNAFIGEEVKKTLSFLRSSIPSYQACEPSSVFLQESNFIIKKIYQGDMNLSFRDPAIFEKMSHTFDCIKPLYQKVFHWYDETNEINYELYERQTLPFRLMKFKRINSPSTEKKVFVLKNTSSLMNKELFQKALSIYDLSYQEITPNDIDQIYSSPPESLMVLQEIDPLGDPSFAAALGVFLERGSYLWISSSKDKFHIPSSKVQLIEYLLNARLIKSYNSKLDFSNLLFSTGKLKTQVREKNGNVYPHRYPVARYFPISEKDSKSLPFKSPKASFSSFWESWYLKSNGPRMLLWKESPFQIMDQEEAKKHIQKVLSNFYFPLDLIYISSIHLQETASQKLLLKLNHRREKNEEFELLFTLYDQNNQVLQKKELLVPLKEEGVVSLHFPVQELFPSLPSNAFKIQVTPLSKDIFQRVENLVIKPLKAISNPHASQFLKEVGHLGANYYPASNYDSFWFEPNWGEIAFDFQRMESLGLRYVRIHFAQPGWLLQAENQHSFSSPYSKPFSWEEVLPQLLSLAAKYQLTLILDLFSLVGSSMGSHEAWMNDHQRFVDPQKIHQQNAFLRKFSTQTKAYKNLIIDLINEPSIDENELKNFHDWAQNKIQLIRSLNPNIPITIGSFRPLFNDLGLDFSCLHGYQVPDDSFDGPVMFEEFWRLRPQRAPKSEAWVRIQYEKSIEKGVIAFLPFSFIAPQNLSPRGSHQERWEYELGMWFHPDGSKKSTLMSSKDLDN